MPDGTLIGTVEFERRSNRLGRRYWNLVAATGASALGDGLVLVAFPLLAVSLTRSPILIAGITVVGQLPWLLISLPAGALADRLDRRRLVVRIEIVRAVVLLTLGLLIVTGHRSLVALYLATFLIGACETAFSAATNASVPSLLRRDDLPRGNGYLFAADTAGEQFAGPALGGVLFGWWTAAPFLGDAVSFLASALLLLRALPRRAATVPVPSRSLLDDVLFGLRWFLHQRLLRLLAMVIGTFAFCQAAVWAVLVLYGVRILHLSTAGYGIFLAVAALGNVAGGVIAGRVFAKLGPFWSIVGAGLLAGSGFVLLSRTSWVGVAVIGVAIQAVAVAVGNVATLSLRHAIVPTELLGRVNNAFRTCIWGVMPLGALVGGVLASQVGLHTTFLIAGLGQIGAIILASRLLALRMAAEPALHRSERP